MFRGHSALTLDSKWRMSIPRKYRQELLDKDDGQLVITLDPALYLAIYPLSEWVKIEQNLSETPGMEHIKLTLIGFAEDCQVDKSGRVLIPPLLREEANIEKQVVLVGQGKKLVLLSEQDWKVQRETSRAYMQTPEGKAKLGSIVF